MVTSRVLLFQHGICGKYRAGAFEAVNTAALAAMTTMLRVFSLALGWAEYGKMTFSPLGAADTGTRKWAAATSQVGVNPRLRQFSSI
ncbi:hypothetical protein TrVFT333_000778 [Trichoderma virens FT-333]|nr:hypothetical protein TrVFT333_000778 [Trichoderma virens FT-333]